jgi:hypothetical protein
LIPKKIEDRIFQRFCALGRAKELSAPRKLRVITCLIITVRLTTNVLPAGKARYRLFLVNNVLATSSEIPPQQKMDTARNETNQK